MQKTLPSMCRMARVGAACAVLAAGCSGSQTVEPMIPTAEQTRAFYGLEPGSCFRYDIPAKSTFGVLEVEGPNTTSVAGRTVFDQELFLDTAERPFRRQIEADAEGQLRLVRWIEGSGTDQVIHRYEGTEAPVFLRLRTTPAGEVELERGARFEIQTAPEICQAGVCNPSSDGELHAWTVLEDATTLPTPDGDMETIQLQYRLQIGGTTRTERYWLAPGRGFAQFIDAQGARYSVCAWKICAADGTCSTDLACTELSCS